MEQRTDETARRPGVAAEDTGPPTEDQSGNGPAADDAQTDTNGHAAGDRESGWEQPGRPARPSFTPTSPSSFGSAPGGRSSKGNRSGGEYPADSAYNGNAVEDGYGPPGTERKDTDFPSSSVASQTFGAAPAEGVYGSPSGQRDHAPYPSQVTAAARPQTEDPRSRPGASSPAGSGAPQAGVPGSPGYGTVQEGYLETSNVNSVNEITNLITAQRAYEMNSKVINAADQMMQQTSQMAQG